MFCCRVRSLLATRPKTPPSVDSDIGNFRADAISNKTCQYNKSVHSMHKIGRQLKIKMML
jgi:hypothetical protein